MRPEITSCCERKVGCNLRVIALLDHIRAMTFLRPTRRQWIALAVVVGIYGLGYIAARQTRWLVHRVSYETKESGTKRYFHWIDRGDFGRAFYLFHGDDFYGVAVIRGQVFIYCVFIPLRLIEASAWHLIPRRYEWRSDYD